MNKEKENKSKLGIILLILDLFLICGALFVAYGRNPIVYASELDTIYSLPSVDTDGQVSTPFYTKYKVNTSNFGNDVSSNVLNGGYIYYIKPQFNTLPNINYTYGNKVLITNRDTYNNVLSSTWNNNLTGLSSTNKLSSVVNFSVFDYNSGQVSFAYYNNTMSFEFTRGVMTLSLVPYNLFHNQEYINLHINTGVPYRKGSGVTNIYFNVLHNIDFTLFDMFNSYNILNYTTSNKYYYDRNSANYNPNYTYLGVDGDLQASKVYENLINLNVGLTWGINDYTNPIQLVEDYSLSYVNNCNEMYLSIPNGDYYVNYMLVVLYYENLGYTSTNLSNNVLDRCEYFPYIEYLYDGLPLENAYNEYSNGYNLGYNDGYDIGYNEGYNSAINVGFENGYNEGYSQGYNKGVIDGVNSVNTEDYYDQGYSAGYSYGHDIGYDNGYTEGYDYGVTTSSHDFGFKDLLFVVANTPITLLMNALSFNVFGVNVWAFIMTLLTAVLVVWIVRKMLGSDE